MVKAILFDFWGTLIENGVSPSPVRQVKDILQLDRLPFPLFILQFEKSFMTQKFDDLYKGFENVCNEFRINPDKYKLDLLVGMWNKNKIFAKPFPETIEILEQLKGKYKMFLVANTDCFSVESVIEKYALSKYFDKIYLSYQMGMLKSNPKVFDTILKEEGLKKEEAIMVGDSMESDIIGAENAGLKAILVDRNDRREYKTKILTLKELPNFLSE